MHHETGEAPAHRAIWVLGAAFRDFHAAPASAALGPQRGKRGIAARRRQSGKIDSGQRCRGLPASLGKAEYGHRERDSGSVKGHDPIISQNKCGARTLENTPTLALEVVDLTKRAHPSLSFRTPST